MHSLGCYAPARCRGAAAAGGGGTAEGRAYTAAGAAVLARPSAVPQVSANVGGAAGRPLVVDAVCRPPRTPMGGIH